MDQVHHHSQSAQPTGFAAETLGERIVRAARLAAAMHLSTVAFPQENAERIVERNAERLAERPLRQRVVIGGAGPSVQATITDDGRRR